MRSWEGSISSRATPLVRGAPKTTASVSFPGVQLSSYCILTPHYVSSWATQNCWHFWSEENKHFLWFDLIGPPAQLASLLPEFPLPPWPLPMEEALCPLRLLPGCTEGHSNFSEASASIITFDLHNNLNTEGRISERKVVLRYCQINILEIRVNCLFHTMFQ